MCKLVPELQQQTCGCEYDNNDLTSPHREKLIFAKRLVGRTEGHCRTKKHVEHTTKLMTHFDEDEKTAVENFRWFESL